MAMRTARTGIFRDRRPRRVMSCLLQVPDREIEVRSDANDTAGAELEASRHELADMRQELIDQKMQLTQGNAALITANEKVQALESELAAANQKQADAKADRAEALRVAGKMWEDWRRLRQNLNAACGALAAGNIKTAATTCATTDQ